MATHPSAGPALARQACERFAGEAAGLVDGLPGRVIEALSTLGGKRPAMALRETMDAEAVFRQKSRAWVDTAQREWCKAQGRQPQSPLDTTDLGADESLDFRLVDDDEMDRTVIAGRLAAAISDKAGQALTDLRIRIQNLDRRSDAVSGDVLRPETFAKVLVDAWVDCGLTHAQWELVQDAVHKYAAQGLREAYEHANAFLIQHGAMVEIDLRAMVRRAPSGVTGMGRMPGAEGGPSIPGTLPGRLYPTGSGNYVAPPLYPSNAGDVPAAGGFLYAAPGSVGWAGYESVMQSGSISGGGFALAGSTTPVAAGFTYVPPDGMGRAGYETAFHGAGDIAQDAMDVAGSVASGSPGGWSTGGLVAHAMSPLVVQQRVRSVLGDVRQFVARYAGAVLPRAAQQPVSHMLALALMEPPSAAFLETEYLPREGQEQAPKKEIGPAELDKATEALKDKAGELKDKTERPDEKAIIEIVSLMFQAILADERMPPALRVWFGRLQVPVLRVALAEPEFFAAPDHPARLLIDRMGACAMGLDNAQVDGGRLEQEVKRIVQVIEQYPETGKKVFQIVLGEFERFLGSALTQGQPQKFASLAQQIEQKDALTIQYTIELRRMLSAVPVGEDVREFLFRVWSEVLALAAVRHGAQAVETVRFKQTAADLLWAVSPKTDRAERQQVTQYLPGILQALREGMATLAMRQVEQDGHIRLLNEAARQAFSAPTGGITPSQMNELARALTGLEDVVTDDPEGDLLLDPSLLEQMLGVDSENLQVVASGGVRPGADMLQWARGLQRGEWFTLQCQSVAAVRVKYVWRSTRGQLHLFATASGKSYLIQTRRLASYLQAGLIAPLEDDALTIRATREALDRLGREPERLLH